MNVKKEKNRPSGLKYNVTKLLKHNCQLPEKQIGNTNILSELEEETNIVKSFTTIVLDAEWSSAQNNVPITVQAFLPKYNQLVIILNLDLKVQNPELYAKNKATFHGHQAFVYEFSFSDTTSSSLYEALKKLSQLPAKNGNNPKGLQPIPLHTNYRLVFYYSAKDVMFALGEERFKTAAFNGYTHYKSVNWVVQRNVIMGKIKISTFNSSLDSTFFLYDMVSSSSARGLEGLCNENNVEMLSKGSMENYKEDMLLAFFHANKNIRSDFARYAIDDVKCLSQAYLKRIQITNDVITSVLHLDPKYQISESDFPNGIGRLVEEIIISSIESHCEKFVSREEYLKAIHSFGYLNILHTKYQENIVVRKELLSNGGTLKELEAHFNNKNYKFNALNLGSIQFLLSHDNQNFAHKGAYVTGGRTQNQRYKEVLLNKIVDLDLQNCYGFTINSLPLPLGHPVVISRDVNKNNLTLGQFLHKYRHSLEDHCWKVIVNAKLNFDQDLVFSRLLPEGIRGRNKSMVSLYNRLAEDDSDGGNFNLGEPILLLRELINSCITTDVLRLIDAIATNTEKHAFYNAIVEVAIFYPKEKKCETVEEWVQKSNSNDPLNRHSWFPFELKNITSNLLSYRKSIKQQMLNETDLQKKKVLDSKQLAIKLINNSLYGVLASPLFRIGNCITSEIITSRARCKVWLMGKALNGSQFVTDGSIFEPNNVLSIRKVDNRRLPGFHLFADIYRLKASRYIESKALNDLDWEAIYKNKQFDYNLIANLSKEHIDEFFAPYNLSLDFNVEVKLVGSKSAQFLKAHYAVQCFNPKDNEFSERVYKIRGIREFNHKNERHPMYDFFDSILDEQYSFPTDLKFVKTRLLKIASWRRKVRKDRSLLTDSNYSPGSIVNDDQSEVKFHARHFPVADKKEYLSRKRSFGSEYNSFHLWKKSTSIIDMVNQMVDTYC